MKLNMQDNPALVLGGLTAGSITAAVIAIMALCNAFGWHQFTDQQYTQVGVFIAAMWAVVVPLVLSIRSAVYAPSTVEGIKTTLAAEDPNTPLSSGAAKALAA